MSGVAEPLVTSAIVESDAVAHFDGGRSRTAPLAWGQQGTWDMMVRWLPEMKPYFVLTRWLDVPLLLGLEDVLEQIGELVRRHEGLRTLYRATPRGDAVQEVLAEGTVAVRVFDRPADDPVPFADVVVDCIGRATAGPFDHDREVPLRCYVALHEGIPVLVIFGVSHLSADHMSADLLAAELGALLRARADGAAAPPPRPAAQPVDLALSERSPAGQLLNVEALTHLREQVRLLPVESTLPARATPLRPRYLRGEIESDVIPLAVRVAARRYRTTTSVLLLAVLNSLVGRITTAAVYPVEIMQGNRTNAELLHTVSSLNQAVRITAPLTATTIEDLIRDTGRAMAAARRHGRYDRRAADEVVRAAALARGGEPELGCQFNDRWSILPRPAGAPARTVDDAALRRAAEHTVFGWHDRMDSEGMVMFVDTYGTAERMRVSLLADTALLPPADIHGFLTAFERIVSAMARGPVTVDDIDAEFDRAHRTVPPPVPGQDS